MHAAVSSRPSLTRRETREVHKGATLFDAASEVGVSRLAWLLQPKPTCSNVSQEPKGDLLRFNQSAWLAMNAHASGMDFSQASTSRLGYDVWRDGCGLWAANLTVIFLYCLAWERVTK